MFRFSINCVVQAPPCPQVLRRLIQISQIGRSLHKLTSHQIAEHRHVSRTNTSTPQRNRI